MYLIRSGTEADLPDALRLIVELAVYEREPSAVVTTVESMRRDGFGESPAYGFFVAAVETEIVGISLFYDRYSTWRGKCLYLEDLIVSQSHRRSGIGQALFERTLKKARDDGYRGMSWQVLDWNEPAIAFYNKYNAKIETGWLNASLSATQIQPTKG